MSAPLVADTGGVLRALGRPQWPRGLGGVRERPPRRFSCIFFPGAAPTRFSRAISDGRATRRGFSLGSHRHVPLMERDSFTDARDALKRSVEHRQMFERSRRHRSDRLRRRRMLARGAPLLRSEWWNRGPRRPRRGAMVESAECAIGLSAPPAGAPAKSRLSFACPPCPPAGMRRARRARVNARARGRDPRP